MKKLLPFALAILISSVHAQDQVLRVPNTPLNRLLLQKLDLDFGCFGRSEKHLEFLVDDEAREKLATNRQLGSGLMSQAEVVIENVQAKNEEALTSRSSDLGRYHTVAEAMAEVQRLAEEFSDLVQLDQETETFEGRSIPVLTLKGEKASLDAPAYLVMGSHHAREWISLEVPLHFMRKLLTDYRAGDDRRVRLLDSSRIVVVPMVNPDGCEYSRTKRKMWRKNRRVNEGTSAIGVDNNRNYPYKWGVAGSSSYAGSDTYMGPEAGSEKENQLIMKLAEEHKFVAAVSFHSYSELVLWPWGYTNRIQARDHAIFKKYGDAMGKVLGYKPMQISGLYEASGGFDDELYATHNVLSYTIELATWFIPSESEIAPICEKSHEALMGLFLTARDPFLEASKDSSWKVQGDVQLAVADVLNGRALNSTRVESLQHYDEKTLNQAMDALKMDRGLRDDLNRALLRARQFPQ